MNIQQGRMYNQGNDPPDHVDLIHGFMGKSWSISTDMTSFSVSYTLWTGLKTLYLLLQLHAWPALILQIKQTLASFDPGSQTPQIGIKQ